MNNGEEKYKTSVAYTFGQCKKGKKGLETKKSTPNNLGPDSYNPRLDYLSCKKFAQNIKFENGNRFPLSRERLFKNPTYEMYNSIGKQYSSDKVNSRQYSFGKAGRNQKRGFLDTENRQMTKLNLPHAKY